MEIMQKEIFTNYIDVEFEGRMFSSLRDYNTYLSKIYGDYKELPPEDKRVTHHTFKAYFKEERHEDQSSCNL